METQGLIEAVTKSELLGLSLATWDRMRTSEQLEDFISRREAAINGLDEEV